MAVHDYVCSVCNETFSRTTTAEDEAVTCPACGSPLVRESWESRLRNADDSLTPRWIEEMRDCVG